MSEMAPDAGLRGAFRDVRVLGAIRLAALVGGVLAIWPTLADAERRDLAIVVTLLGVGFTNQVAVFVARSGRVRDRLSEAGMVFDIVILGALLHVSGARSLRCFRSSSCGSSPESSPTSPREPSDTRS